MAGAEAAGADIAAPLLQWQPPRPDLASADETNETDRTLTATNVRKIKRVMADVLSKIGEATGNRTANAVAAPAWESIKR